MDEAAAHVEFLKQFLAARDLPCPGCRYNLRGLTSDKCPECGSEVQLSVGLTEPRMGAFVAGVVGIAAGLGFDVLLMLYVGWVVSFSVRGGRSLKGMWSLPLGAAVMGIALVFWLRQRRTIRLMSAPKRWLLVAACYALSLGAAVLFFAKVR